MCKAGRLLPLKANYRWSLSSSPTQAGLTPYTAATEAATQLFKIPECFQHAEEAKLMLQATFHSLCGEPGPAQMKLPVADTTFTRSFLQSGTKLGKTFRPAMCSCTAGRF